MESIPLPNLKLITADLTKGVFEISPLYPGYGPTIANALRRILLSSLPGTAIDSIKIEGADHEFTTIPGVKEDIVELILNLKSLRFNLLGESESAVLNLEKTSPGPVTALDFAKNSEVEILDPDKVIANLDKNGKLIITLNLKKGRGFVPSENKEHEKEIGLIAIDSFYSPVRHVAFNIENTRVGQATNYDKITLTVETDGSFEPQRAIEESAKILTEHYALIAQINTADALTKAKEELDQKLEEISNLEQQRTEETTISSTIAPPIDPKTKIEDLELSGRTKNALIASGYKTVSGLKRLSEIKLAGIKGLGAKGLEEVVELLKRVED